MNSLKIKKNDKVVVLSGKDKGKTGKENLRKNLWKQFKTQIRCTMNTAMQRWDRSICCWLCCIRMAA